MKKQPDDPKVLETEKKLIFELTKARIGLGWSQQQLSQRAGFADNLIGRMERGEQSPRLTTVIKFCNVLDLNLWIQ